MTAVIYSSSWFPRSLNHHRPAHGACCSWVQATFLGQSPHHRRLSSTMGMFKQPNAIFEAKNKGPQPRAPLEKHLPSNSQSQRHDANIKDRFQSFNRAGPSSVRPNSSQQKSFKPVAPLRPKSSNPSQPFKPPSSRLLASIYNNSQNSFKEEDNIIDLTGDGMNDSKQKKTVAGVDFFEDDFSDDDTLDLEYQLPQALPTAATSTAVKKDANPPPENTSDISWPMSSPSHFRPAQSVSQSTNAQSSSKRSAPENDPSVMQPVAKKRTLPNGYEMYRQTKEDPISTSDTNAAPVVKPTSKAKGPQTWDLDPETVKAQQKKLKVKSKRPAPSGTEVSKEEMQEAVKSHTVKQSAISLSNEQDLVKELVCDKNKSVFFTGPAGTGKSVLMRAIIAQLKKKYTRDPERLAVTASTGLAACNIGGMTLHSFSGIGLGKEDVQTLIKKIRRNPKAKNRWLKTKVLIIDEISMVDGDLFDKLSQIGRTLRNNGRPWGGIQLVITGDFFQLPPVPDHGTRDVKFAFEAATWNTSIDHTIGLTEVFRQKDPVFAQMLNEMRLGRISDQTVSTFKSLSRPLHFEDGLEVTELFPTRNEVDNSNQRRLRELPGEPQRYEALDSGDPAIREKLLSNMMAPKSLELKKGAQVMLIKNLDDTLVNGSLGTVIGFSTESAFEISNGAFEDEGGFGNNAVDPLVKKRLAAFSRELDKGTGADKRKYPLVQFHSVDGSARIMLCVPEPWKVETPTGEVQASREQLPLILAWALSIHKAQGQTLERVKVDLGRVFEKGQAYVALSRATTQGGLQVMRFDKQKVMAHPRVVSFYQKLYSAESAIKPKKAANTTITSFVSQMASRQPARKPSDDFIMDDEEEIMASYAHVY